MSTCLCCNSSCWVSLRNGDWSNYHWQETVKFHLEPTGSQTNLQSLVALLKQRWSETSLISDGLIYYEITFFFFFLLLPWDEKFTVKWKKHQIIDSEKVIGALIISCCWYSGTVSFIPSTDWLCCCRPPSSLWQPVRRWLGASLLCEPETLKRLHLCTFQS